MKTVKVKTTKNLLCPCKVLPCEHFTLADHCMVLPKTKFTRSIIKQSFIFPLFVLHLCKFIGSKINFFVKKAVKYGIDINEVDRESGFTALHYAYMCDRSSVIAYLLKQPNIQAYTLDIYGLPPQVSSAFYSDCPQANLRKKLCLGSKKLFNFVFHDIIPKKWSCMVFANMTIPTLKLMNERQLRKVLDIKDEKGNSLLHFACKTNNSTLVELILSINNSYAKLVNIKGKKPIEYCKTHATFKCFNSATTFYQPIYFRTNSIHNFQFTTLGFILDHCPDIALNLHKNQKFVCSNLNIVINCLLTRPDLGFIKKISKLARDTMGNTLFHKVVTHPISAQFASTLFLMFDTSVINERNWFGDTPLHLATDEITKQELVKFGAHLDSLNNKNELAYKRNLNLQCISAINIPRKHFLFIPNHLKDFVSLHHANVNETIQLSCIKENL